MLAQYWIGKSYWSYGACPLDRRRFSKTCSAELERLVSAVAAVGEPCPPGPPPRD